MVGKASHTLNSKGRSLLSPAQRALLRLCRPRIRAHQPLQQPRDPLPRLWRQVRLRAVLLHLLAAARRQGQLLRHRCRAVAAAEPPPPPLLLLAARRLAQPGGL